MVPEVSDQQMAVVWRGKKSYVFQNIETALVENLCFI